MSTANIHAMMFRTECIRSTFPSTGLLVTLRGPSCRTSIFRIEALLKREASANWLALRRSVQACTTPEPAYLS
jgi:hypothetical protein